MNRISKVAQLSALFTTVALTACGGGGDYGSHSGPPTPAPAPTPTPAPAPTPTPTPAPPPTPSPAPAPTPTPTPPPAGGGGAIANPIVFVTQVPTLTDFAGRGSTFGNHGTSVEQVLRGGDLMIRYPDGTIRNLTKEAGFGMEGAQGDNAIAVREPSVHWSGKKILFSMLVGSPTAATSNKTFYWQLYEASNFAVGQKVSIAKVANQPANYNNVSPIYASDDRVLFTSDRPRSGLGHLYPALDEYESATCVTGIWSLNPSSGDLHLLNHTPSGVFSPTIDSAGRVIFTRWDHLQHDQQFDAGVSVYGSRTFTDESATSASHAAVSADEVFPESRSPSTDSAYGAVNAYTNNLFSPWQMNQDGTGEETLNHVGRHELAFTDMTRSFTSDPALSDTPDASLRQNAKAMRMDGGLFHLREDPSHPGDFLAIMSREFGSLTSNQIIRLTGSTVLTGDRMVMTDVTVGGLDANGSPDGRYRNPLPLAAGGLVATYTTLTHAGTQEDVDDLKDFRLKLLSFDAVTGLYKGSGAAPFLTPGFTKTISMFNPDNQAAPITYSGPLWELEAVEVVARTAPTRAPEILEAPELSVFAAENVDEQAFRAWLVANNLALIVTRNITSRDAADTQQPYNLRVPGGVSSVSSHGGKVYDITHFQVLQADQIRGYTAKSGTDGGRRNLAQFLHDPAAVNVPNPGGPAGSVKIAADGSTATLVPARRALAWQTTDAAGHPVVRERDWVTFQPGEIRVCASCHGVNSKDQAGRTPPTNAPQALHGVLQSWKALPE